MKKFKTTFSHSYYVNIARTEVRIQEFTAEIFAEDEDQARSLLLVWVPSARGLKLIEIENVDSGQVGVFLYPL